MQKIIRQHVAQTIYRATGKVYTEEEVSVERATLPHLADFQSSVAFKLSGVLGERPALIARWIAEHCGSEGRLSSVTVTEPGYLNYRFNDDFIVSALEDLVAEIKPRSEGINQEQRVVIVDYSGPNAAKQMHVGHLRSTVIGDCIANLYEFLGWRTIRVNHVGDWGTQFGMIIEYYIESGGMPLATISLEEIENIYRLAKTKFDSDDEFRSRAQERVVKLQSEDLVTLQHWEAIRGASIAKFQELYDVLGVKLTPQCIVGESWYRDKLYSVVNELIELKLAESDCKTGVSIAKVPLKSRKEPYPYIIRKMDGGYLYATTDLAAVRFRLQELKADRVVYVADARQEDHFQCLFQLAELTNWSIAPSEQLVHASFGTVLGENGAPLKTRESRNVLLIELIEEGKRRALQMCKLRNPEWTEDAVERLASTLAIASIKYADLSVDRQKNYVFDWEKFLSFEGNTVVYIISAITRAKSVLKKAGEVCSHGALPPSEGIGQLERLLILKIIEMKEAVSVATETHRPHILCNYLYDLAKLFHRFYETVFVLKGCSPGEMAFRVQLYVRFIVVAESVLSLLGIDETFERL